MIKGTVNGQKLKISTPLIVDQSLDYLTCSFQFYNDDWDGLIKFAHFIQGKKKYVIQLNEFDDVTKDKHLNLSEGIWQVMLHGNEIVGDTTIERITTNAVEIEVEPCAILEGEPPLAIPPTEGEQILATAEDAKRIAESVRADADAGKFNGKDGEGVAKGGTVGQILTKKSNADFDTEWIDKPKEVLNVEIEDDGFGGYRTIDYNDNDINNFRNNGGIVQAKYYDMGKNQTYTYYYSTMESDRKPTFIRTYVNEQGRTEQVLASVDHNKKVTVERRVSDVGVYFATCNDEPSPASVKPNVWYVPKTMPKPSNKVGTIINVKWLQGRASGIGYDIQLVWGEEGGADNEVIIDVANTTGSPNGVAIKSGGTVTYQLTESNGRKHWRFVSGDLLYPNFSTDTASDVADKVVPNLTSNYVNGMEIYLQLDNGNTAETMRLVNEDGTALPVYGNGTGAKTGNIEKGYILHLKNAGNYWQIINGGTSSTYVVRTTSATTINHTFQEIGEAVKNCKDVWLIDTHLSGTVKEPSYYKLDAYDTDVEAKFLSLNSTFDIVNGEATAIQHIFSVMPDDSVNYTDEEWVSPQGIPTGGAKGQVLVKSSDVNYATEWQSKDYVVLKGKQYDYTDLSVGHYLVSSDASVVFENKTQYRMSRGELFKTDVNMFVFMGSILVSEPEKKIKVFPGVLQYRAGVISACATEQYVDEAVANVKITADTEMSSTSENPVQNKVISQNVAPALVNTETGSPLELTDGSKIPHKMKATAKSKNLLLFAGREQLRDKPIIVEDNKYMFVGINRAGQTSGRASINEYTENKVTFTALLTWWGIGFMVAIEPSRAFVVSATMPPTVAIGLTYYDKNKNFISQQLASGGTTPPNCAFLMVSFCPKNSNGVNVSLTIENIQIEYGTTSTSVTPYVADGTAVNLTYNGTVCPTTVGGAEIELDSADVMNFSTDVNGAVASVTYNADVKKYIDKKLNELVKPKTLEAII